MILLRLLYKYLKSLATTYTVCREWVVDLRYDHPNLYRLALGFIVIFWALFICGVIAAYAMLWLYLWVVALIITILAIAFLLGLMAEDF